MGDRAGVSINRIANHPNSGEKREGVVILGRCLFLSSRAGTPFLQPERFKFTTNVSLGKEGASLILATCKGQEERALAFESNCLTGGGCRRFEYLL